jgi:hypothetical protein
MIFVGEKNTHLRPKFRQLHSNDAPSKVLEGLDSRGSSAAWIVNLEEFM